MKKGFTLVELLAVIVVLTVLTLIAVPNVINILNEEKEKTLDIVKNNLIDATNSYAKEQINNGNIKLNRCPKNIEVTSANFSSYDSDNTRLSSDKRCAYDITVNTLLTEGYFEDKNGYCDKDKKIIIYKYYNGNYEEIKVSIPDNACSNK